MNDQSGQRGPSDTGHSPRPSVEDAAAMEAWARYCRETWNPATGSAEAERVYRDLYGLQPEDGFPASAWVPDPEIVEAANLTKLCRELGLDGPESLHRWSVENRVDFWELMIRKIGLSFLTPPESTLDPASSVESPRWLPGATFNIAANCFLSPPGQTAVIVGQEDGTLIRHSQEDLGRLANQVANGLRDVGIREGDAVAVILPMTLEAVAIYLGTILAGAVVVSIADSFAAGEIELRLRIADAKLVFTANAIVRGGKALPLFSRVGEAAGPAAVVLNAPGTSPAGLRERDRTWENFLSAKDSFRPVALGPDDTINILFSSGTTGTPKAIPWTQTTPLKCAADAFLHHDLRPGDVACWPTNLGWMMGPWLIFATLLNRGTVAIYEGLPHSDGFCRFVEEAGVTLLGVIPSLVRAWRENGALDRAVWTRLRAFSSTGECSNPADMFHLMSRAGFRPVIEYCGGTEIGGGYLSATVAKPLAPATFNLPACGLDLVVLDEENRAAEKGEVFLVGPSIGLSTRLLNADHHDVYYANTPPGPGGCLLRRHGDHVERLPGGAHRMLGRQDDTMNLGGIKVGSAEIERALATVPTVRETAAVASDDGGPSRLLVFAVPNPETFTGLTDLETDLRRALRERLNPLFKISEIHLVESLPRTASNKVMRRLLRARAEEKKS